MCVRHTTYHVCKTILNWFWIFVGNETIVLWSSYAWNFWSWFWVNSQVNDRAKASEHHLELFFGCMVWYISQEQLMVVTELICVARSSFYANTKCDVIAFDWAWTKVNKTRKYFAILCKKGKAISHESNKRQTSDLASSCGLWSGVQGVVCVGCSSSVRRRRWYKVDATAEIVRFEELSVCFGLILNCFWHFIGTAMIIIDVVLLALDAGQIVLGLNIHRCLCTNIVLLVDFVLQCRHRNIFQIVYTCILIAHIGQLIHRDDLLLCRQCLRLDLQRCMS